jgi:hypothetical protein
VTEGGEDGEGRFHHVAEFQDSLLAEFFSREVFALLLRHELISEALVEKISGWRHSGFSVHSKVKASTKKEAERVGKYMIRPLLSLERLSFSEKEAKICYRYGKDTEEVERMDYLEFIARVVSPIPHKGQVTIRYFGLYANAHRGKVRKSEEAAGKLIIIEEECPRIPRRLRLPSRNISWPPRPPLNIFRDPPFNQAERSGQFSDHPVPSTVS